MGLKYVLTEDFDKGKADFVSRLPFTCLPKAKSFFLWRTTLCTLKKKKKKPPLAA